MIDEQQLIKRYFMCDTNNPHVIVGIGDDAAVLACDDCAEKNSNQRLVVTTDTLVEGCHFKIDDKAEDIGYKALAVSLSDIAAMGASPRWTTLSLSLADKHEAELERWVADFSRGFLALAKQWNVALVGGDLVRGHCTVTVQVGAVVSASKTLLRSNASSGDGIYLTGSVGDAGLAWRNPEKLSMLPSKLATACTTKLRRPVPRIEEGKVIACFTSVAIDVSDGLLLDLSRLLNASNVAAQVQIDLIPLGEGCRSFCHKPEDWSMPLSAGDDYELLFTMTDDCFIDLKQELANQGLAPVSRIGQIIQLDKEHLKCTFEGAHWPLPQNQGFDHFAN